MRTFSARFHGVLDFTLQRECQKLVSNCGCEHLPALSGTPRYSHGERSALLHIRALVENRRWHSRRVRFDFRHLWRHQKPPLQPGVNLLRRQWLEAVAMTTMLVVVGLFFPEVESTRSDNIATLRSTCYYGIDHFPLS
jgi:hypothetical protein